MWKMGFERELREIRESRNRMRKAGGKAFRVGPRFFVPTSSCAETVKECVAISLMGLQGPGFRGP